MCAYSEDSSLSEEMGKRLDDYCEEHFGELVRVLRAPTRLGLIKAKNYGARNGLFRSLCTKRLMYLFSHG